MLQNQYRRFLIYLYSITTNKQQEEPLNQAGCLVGVGKTTHTRHYAEHVIVGSIDIDSGGGSSADSVVGDREEESGVVDTRQVASTRRLVLFRL